MNASDETHGDALEQAGESNFGGAASSSQPQEHQEQVNIGTYNTPAANDGEDAMPNIFPDGVPKPENPSSPEQGSSHLLVLVFAAANAGEGLRHDGMATRA